MSIISYQSFDIKQKLYKTEEKTNLFWLRKTISNIVQMKKNGQKHCNPEVKKQANTIYTCPN